MDVDSLPKALVPEGKQGGGLKIITLDKVKSCLLCGKKMLLKCAMGYGGEVPPASPARYDLTKLGEAEITRVNNSSSALPSGRMAGMELLVLPLVDSKSFLS